MGLATAMKILFEMDEQALKWVSPAFLPQFRLIFSQPSFERQSVATVRSGRTHKYSASIHRKLGERQ